MFSEKVLKSALFIFIISSFLPIFLLKTPNVRSATSHVVISEVQVEGDTANDEFVELYNPTESSIDITGWKLKRLNSAGTTYNLVTSIEGSIPAHGFFLMTHPADYTGSESADDLYSSASYAMSSNNTVILFNDADEVIDKVGMGSASDSPEGSYAPEPPADQSVERKAKGTSTSITMAIGGVDEFLGNGHDTDNNSMDFVSRTTPQPQGSSSEIEPEISTPTPSPTGSPTAEPTTTATPTPSGSPTPEPTDTPSPTPSATPDETPTPEPTDTPSPTPTPSDTPTPEPTETPEPSESPSPTPEESPSPTPTMTATPTASPTMEPTPTPTPTSKSMVIGMFLFPRRKTVCTITYQFYGRGFMRFVFPRISCTRVI